MTVRENLGLPSTRNMSATDINDRVKMPPPPRTG